MYQVPGVGALFSIAPRCSCKAPKSGSASATYRKGKVATFAKKGKNFIQRGICYRESAWGWGSLFCHVAQMQQRGLRAGGRVCCHFYGAFAVVLTPLPLQLVFTVVRTKRGGLTSQFSRMGGCQVGALSFRVCGEPNALVAFFLRVLTMLVSSVTGVCGGGSGGPQ